MSAANSERFLNAFIRIEKELRDIVGEDRYLTFYQLINKAAEKYKNIEKYKNNLKEYGDLRNAIVHNRVGGEVIAEPHLKIVEELEFIGDMIANPPTLEAGFLSEVITASTIDNIKVALKRMYGNSFSKIPIYDGSIFKGMLTSEIIARWIADNIDEDMNLLKNSTIGEVQDYNENKLNYRFVSRKTSLFEVVTLYEEANRIGQKIEAILVTEKGKDTERPIGIITVFDLPKIYEMIEK